jgi:hypothetical protein
LQYAIVSLVDTPTRTKFICPNMQRTTPSPSFFRLAGTAYHDMFVSGARTAARRRRQRALSRGGAAHTPAAQCKTFCRACRRSSRPHVNVAYAAFFVGVLIAMSTQKLVCCAEMNTLPNSLTEVKE